MKTTEDDTLIPSAQLRARYGDVSDMWIARRLKDDVTFPRPIYIAKRRFWRIAELAKWERAAALKSPPRINPTQFSAHVAA